ncbi:MAG: hypothetical protein Q9178_000012 [Gyalolechia marmorata]
MYARRLRSSDGFIIFVVGIAVFTDMMLYGLIVPMLPYALSDRVGVAQKDVQGWNSILLGSFGGALMFGSYIVILLTARILSGLSGAVVCTVGYAILFDVVSSEKIGRALGFVSMCQSFGLLVGPALGGILYEHGGYFNTFIPAFALIAIEITLRFLVVVKKRDRSPDGAGHEGQQPSEVSILAKGYTANPLYGTTLPPKIDLSQTDLEHHRENPIKASSDPPSTPQQHLSALQSSPRPPPSPSSSSSSTKAVHLLLTSPRILTALLALFILNTILTAYDATIPIHIRRTFSLPATCASLLFLIMVFPFLLSPLAGYIVDRHGPHFPATLGLLILTPPVFILQLIDSKDFTSVSAGLSPFAAIASCLFTIGFGTAFCLPALMAEVSLEIEAIEKQQPGCFGDKGVVAFGFGVINFAFAGGFLAGPVMAGALVEGCGWRVLNVVLGVGGLACVVGVGMVTGGGGGWRRWRCLGRREGGELEC